MNVLRSLTNVLLFKISPVRSSRFVFTSFNGHYSDSPKYICSAMHDLAPDIEYIWLIERQYAGQLPSWAKWADIRSIRAEWLRGSAVAHIDNVRCGRGYMLTSSDLVSRLKGKIICFLKNKRKQKAYSTWHGTPIKRMGRDQVDSEISDFYCTPLTLFLSSEYYSKIMRHMMFNRIKTVCIGMPRNDILFQPDLREKTKKSLNIPGNKKVILFAPTFRHDGKSLNNKNLRRSGIDQLEQMHYSALFETLTAKFGGDWVMVCRFHYKVEKMVNWEKLEALYPEKFINGNAHDDMAEYLLSADVLITDASSSMFDFALTRRPVFLFFPDLDFYENKERGFYMPMSELPFPVSKDFNCLLKNIREFDEEAYSKDVSKMFNSFGDVDDGNASQRIAEYILKECRQLQVKQSNM